MVVTACSQEGGEEGKDDRVQEKEKHGMVSASYSLSCFSATLSLLWFRKCFAGFAEINFLPSQVSVVSQSLNLENASAFQRCVTALGRLGLISGMEGK